MLTPPLVTEFTTVEQENRNAKQEMNNMYLKMIGDAERLKVLKFLYNHVWLFRIGSVLASMFGFYYDLVLGLGVLGAIATSMLIAYIIEAIKIYGTKASFSYEGWIRYGAIIVTLSVMYSAYLFHYKSLTNYKNMMDKADSSTVYTHKVNQDNAFNQINLELVGVLKNGTNTDDALASSSIQSTNNLLANNGNDYATKAFLDASTITNTGLATTLFLIFIFLETCSLFGVIAGMMLMGSTDKNVKSIVKTQDKLNAMETNIYQAVETQMISNSMVRIEENMKQVSNHPTPTSTENTQQYLPKLPFNLTYSYGLPIQNNGALNSPQSPQNNWFDGKNMTVLPSSSLTVYAKNNDRQTTDGKSVFSKIIDAQNDTWLYYKNWIVLEDSKDCQSIVFRIGSALKEGFMLKELEDKTTKSFIFNDTVDTIELQLMLIEFIDLENKQYNNFKDNEVEEGTIEAEPIEDEIISVKAFNEKIPALDKSMYSDEEQKILLELFDNGTTEIGDFLIGRRFVLKSDTVKKIRKKTTILSSLYEKLKENNLIEEVRVNPNNPVCKYRARAVLYRQKWQDK
jgi:hypothetical protein